MRIGFRAFTCVLALSAAMTGASVVPSFAQSTTIVNPPKVKPVPHRRHLLHPGIGSAASRNVGPSSSVTGTSSAGSAGSPIVPGAPSAGNTTGGGK